MAQENVFRNVISFMGDIGVFDVILPFLLVFTIVFAILEKTKILGVETLEGGQQITKKNLNAIVALVVAFFVVASTKLVGIVSSVMANVVLLLILAVSFLLLVGVFFGDKQFTLDEYPGWVMFFMVVMFIGVVIIFLNALGWLEYIFDLFRYWDAQWASTIILLIVLFAFMWYIVRDPPKGGNKSE